MLAVYRGVAYDTDNLKKEYVYAKRELTYRGNKVVSVVKTEVVK